MHKGSNPIISSRQGFCFGQKKALYSFVALIVIASSLIASGVLILLESQSGLQENSNPSLSSPCSNYIIDKYNGYYIQMLRVSNLAICLGVIMSLGLLGMLLIAFRSQLSTIWCCCPDKQKEVEKQQLDQTNRLMLSQRQSLIPKQMPNYVYFSVFEQKSAVIFLILSVLLITLQICTQTHVSFYIEWSSCSSFVFTEVILLIICVLEGVSLIGCFVMWVIWLLAWRQLLQKRHQQEENSKAVQKSKNQVPETIQKPNELQLETAAKTAQKEVEPSPKTTSAKVQMMQLSQPPPFKVQSNHQKVNDPQGKKELIDQKLPTQNQIKQIEPLPPAVPRVDSKNTIVDMQQPLVNPNRVSLSPIQPIKEEPSQQCSDASQRAQIRKEIDQVKKSRIKMNSGLYSIDHNGFSSSNQNITISQSKVQYQQNYDMPSNGQQNQKPLHFSSSFSRNPYHDERPQRNTIHERLNLTESEKEQLMNRHPNILSLRRNTSSKSHRKSEPDSNQKIPSLNMIDNAGDQKRFVTKRISHDSQVEDNGYSVNYSPYKKYFPSTRRSNGAHIRGSKPPLSKEKQSFAEDINFQRSSPIEHLNESPKDKNQYPVKNFQRHGSRQNRRIGAQFSDYGYSANEASYESNNSVTYHNIKKSLTKNKIGSEYFAKINMNPKSRFVFQPNDVNYQDKIKSQQIQRPKAKKKPKKLDFEEESEELDKKVIQEAVNYLQNSNYDSVLSQKKQAENHRIEAQGIDSIVDSTGGARKPKQQPEKNHSIDAKLDSKQQGFSSNSSKQCKNSANISKQNSVIQSMEGSQSSKKGSSKLKFKTQHFGQGIPSITVIDDPNRVSSEEEKADSLEPQGNKFSRPQLTSTNKLTETKKSRSFSSGRNIYSSRDKKALMESMN